MNIVGATKSKATLENKEHKDKDRHAAVEAASWVCFIYNGHWTTLLGVQEMQICKTKASKSNKHGFDFNNFLYLRSLDLSYLKTYFPSTATEI